MLIDYQTGIGDLVLFPLSAADHQHKLNSLMSHHQTLYLINVPRSFTNKLNSNGDNIQPCFSPEWTLNHSVICPLICTLHFTFTYIDLIVVNVFPEIPVESNFDHCNALLILSYAFLKSTYPTNVDFLSDVTIISFFQKASDLSIYLFIYLSMLR